MVPLDTRRSKAKRPTGSRQGGQPWAWLHARARLMPQLLIQAPPWVRGVFDHSWASMEALSRQVSCLPAFLLDYLLSCDGGFVSICSGESRYVVGPATIQRHQVQNVAFVSVQDLAADSEHPLHTIGHLIDHYLGCAGDPAAAWLSDGGGVTPAWHEAGTRLLHMFTLDYGVDEVARSNIRDYFAQSLACYCRDWKKLSVADPQITKWFRSTLWNEAFWRRQNRQKEN